MYVCVYIYICIYIYIYIRGGGAEDVMVSPTVPSIVPVSSPKPT